MRSHDLQPLELRVFGFKLRELRGFWNPYRDGIPLVPTNHQ